MRFPLDECLSPSYIRELAARGYADAIRPTHIGLKGTRDDLVLARALADDRIVITSNARDFRKLLQQMPIHPGAVVVEHLTRKRSWDLIQLALAFIELQPHPADYMVNRVVEVSVTADVRPYLLAQDLD